jgi:hypothetical protein
MKAVALICFAFWATVSAAPVAAQETFAEKQFGNWRVYGWARGCWMRTLLPDGTSIAFSDDRRRGDFYVTLSNPGWASIQDRKTYPIRVQFGMIDTVVNGFGARNTGAPPSVGMFLRASDSSPLDTLKRAPSIQFSLQGKSLASVSAMPTAPAFAYFEKCFVTLGLYVDDPFAPEATSSDPFQ